METLDLLESLPFSSLSSVSTLATLPSTTAPGAIAAGSAAATAALAAALSGAESPAPTSAVAGLSPKARTRQYLRMEAYCFTSLSFLVTISQSPEVISYLSTTPALRLLLSLMRDGSPRIQRLSLRALGVILPGVSPRALAQARVMDVVLGPASADKKVAVVEGDSTTGVDGGFIDYLFQKLGAALITEQSASANSNSKPAGEKKPTTNPMDCRTGEVLLCQAADYVALLRTLSRTESAAPAAEFDLKSADASAHVSWATLISGVIQRSLLGLSKLVAPGGSKTHLTGSRYVCVLRCLCV
jgi:hypothetical protein